MAPFGIIYIFNWVIFIIIFVSLLRKSKAKSENKTNEKSFRKKLRQQFIIALTLSLLFGLGWGVGMIATTSIPEIGVSLTLQAIFIVLTSFQGLLVFIMHCMRSTDARKEWARWINIVTCHRLTLGQKKKMRFGQSITSGELTYRNKFTSQSGTISTGATSSDTLKRAVKKDLEKTLSSESAYLSSQLEPVEEEKRDLSLQPHPEDGSLHNSSEESSQGHEVEHDLTEALVTVNNTFEMVEPKATTKKEEVQDHFNIVMLDEDGFPGSPRSALSPPPVGAGGGSLPAPVNFTFDIDMGEDEATGAFFANKDASINAEPEKTTQL